MKALVIEDDKNLAKLLSTWLVLCGYEVTVVDSLAAAEKHIKDVPDLRIITLDLNLTDSRHEATIPRIREIRIHNPTALLVVISGVITHHDSKMVTSLGADAMIEKYEIPTERTFLGKLTDVLTSLFSKPATENQKRAALLEGVAEKVARRCNMLKQNIGQGLANEVPPKP